MSDSRLKLRPPTPPKSPTAETVSATIPKTKPASLPLARSTCRFVPTLTTACIEPSRSTPKQDADCERNTTAPSCEPLFFSSQSIASTRKADGSLVHPDSSADVTQTSTVSSNDHDGANTMLRVASAIPPIEEQQHMVESTKHGSSAKFATLEESRSNLQCDSTSETAGTRAIRIKKESEKLRMRLQADLLKQSARVQQIALSREVSTTVMSTHRPNRGMTLSTKRPKANTKGIQKVRPVVLTAEASLGNRDEEMLPTTVQIEPRDLRYKADRRRRRAEREARRRRGQVGRIFMLPPPRH